MKNELKTPCFGQNQLGAATSVPAAVDRPERCSPDPRRLAASRPLRRASVLVATLVTTAAWGASAGSFGQGSNDPPVQTQRFALDRSGQWTRPMPIGPSRRLIAEGWRPVQVLPTQLDADGVADLVVGWTRGREGRIVWCWVDPSVVDRPDLRYSEVEVERSLCRRHRTTDVPVAFAVMSTNGSSVVVAEREGHQLHLLEASGSNRSRAVTRRVALQGGDSIQALLSTEASADSEASLAVSVEYRGEGRVAFLSWRALDLGRWEEVGAVELPVAPTQLLRAGSGRRAWIAAAAPGSGFAWLDAELAHSRVRREGIEWNFDSRVRRLVPIGFDVGGTPRTIERVGAPGAPGATASLAAGSMTEQWHSSTRSAGSAWVDLHAVRWNRDARPDRLGVHAEIGPAVQLSTRGAQFVVNSTDSLGDSIPGDGICDTENNPPDTPPSGVCTLLAAVQQANATAGADLITFNVAGGGVVEIDGSLGGEILELTEAVTIDATSQPGYAGTPLVEVDFRGGGLKPGFSVMADDVVLRGLAITNYPLDCVAIFDHSNTVVEHSYLGLQPDGLPDGCLRGLGTSGDGGLFDGIVTSGNFTQGVFMGAAAVGNVLHDSIVGLDPTGVLAIGNGNLQPGVRIEGPVNSITDSVISANDTVGVWVAGATGTALFNNQIGTTQDGLQARGNAFAGVFVESADETSIGGLLSGSNLISGNVPDSFGNGGAGIVVRASSRTNIVLNRIGTDTTGNAALANQWHGVLVQADQSTDSTETLIFGNVISANGVGSAGGDGVLFDGASEATVRENLIGVRLSSVTDLGNQDHGVRVVEADHVTIGDPGFGNIIAYNGAAGVAIVDRNSGAAGQNTEAIRVSENQVLRNGSLGIDLAIGGEVGDGVTANDPGDADSGANRFQNFPLITGVSSAGGGQWAVSFSLNSTPTTDFDVEIFSNESCDPSGHGEGELFAGAAAVTTDGSGDASGTVLSPFRPTLVTATATGPSDSTSEFSPCWSQGGGGGDGGLLGNRVFVDGNGDGLQAPTDPGVDGVVVRLLNAADQVLDSTITTGGGYYDFANVATGDYRIEFVAPEGIPFTTMDAGSEDSVDSDADPATGRTTLFSYVFGTVDASRDAGLSGLVFADDFESGNVAAWSTSVP